MEYNATPSSGESRLISQLSQIQLALSAGLPGEEMQMRMAPQHRPRPSTFNPEIDRYSRAGVLIGLVPYPDDPAELAVLLIERAHGPDVHAGQIAFPGGKQEQGEDLHLTALRETEEEIGVRRSDWISVGSLSPLYIPPSRFHVQPFLFYQLAFPMLHLNDAEVREVLVVPLSHFRSSGSKEVGEFSSPGGVRVEAPFYKWNEKRIWGATAMMISELCALVEKCGD